MQASDSSARKFSISAGWYIPEMNEVGSTGIPEIVDKFSKFRPGLFSQRKPVNSQGIQKGNHSWCITNAA